MQAYGERKRLTGPDGDNARILFQKVCLETLEQDSSICWLNNERYDQSKVWIPQSVIATYRPWTTLCKKRSIH